MIIDLLGNEVSAILGLEVETLSLSQMIARAVIVYIVALVVVRLGGDKRLLGKHATFDMIISIIFGATLSRAINGSAPFFPTLGAGMVLIAVHWLFASIAVRQHRFEKLIKGRPITLIRNGQVDTKAMKIAIISSNDLQSSLRLQAQINDYACVKEARLEGNGDISIILADE